MTSIDQVQASFEAGDERTRQVILKAGHYLGLSLANLIGVLNIQRIMLTGDMTRFGDTWLNVVKEAMHSSALSRLSDNTRIELGVLDYRAAILGTSAFPLLDDYSILFLQEE